MKLNKSNIDQLGGAGGAEAVTGFSGGASAAAVPSTKSDSVSLSGAARLVALAKAASPARDSRIQSLGSQLRSGSYKTDVEQVTQAVIQEHLAQT